MLDNDALDGIVSELRNRHCCAPHDGKHDRDCYDGMAADAIESLRQQAAELITMWKQSSKAAVGWASDIVELRRELAEAQMKIAVIENDGETFLKAHMAARKGDTDGSR